MSNRKLTVFLRILEVIIQCLVFTGITVAIMFASLGLGWEQLWKCIVIIATVMIAYILRKTVRKFQLFVIGNIVLLISAVMLGTNDNEKFLYFVIVLLIVIYSIRVKIKSVQFKDASAVAKRLAEESAGKKSNRIREHLFMGERVPMAFAGVMVFGYFIGYSVNSVVIKETEVIICVLFVLLQIIYNNLNKLNDVFISNADKSEFPAKQLKSVNKFTLIIVSVLVLIGMLLLYNGEYGNVFSIIRNAGMSVLKIFIGGFLFLLRLAKGKNISQGIEPETQAEESSMVAEQTVQSSPAIEAAAEAFAIVLMIVVIGALVYLIITYVKNLNKSQKLDSDIVECVKTDKKKVKIEKKVYENDASDTKNVNAAVRKVYKKKVKKGFGKEQPDKTFTPQELTKKAITSDMEEADYITRIYEKARYSDEKVTKEELEILKTSIKK